MLNPGKQRVPMLSATALLILAAFLPLWGAVMTAPSYPERNLGVTVYSNRMSGDIDEWGRVSKLVGVKLPPPIPAWTFELLPVVLGALALIALASSFFRPLLPVAVIAPLAFLVVTAAWTQVLLYRIGHDLDPARPLRFLTDFTPPVVGWVKLGRIVTWHFPHLGTFLILAAAIIPAWLWLRRRA